MSIPLDRLYHYIQDVAEQVYNNDIVIYRFYPYGSKNINDIKPLRYDHHHEILVYSDVPEIVCNDQEVLNYEFYRYRVDRRSIDSSLSELYQQGTLPVTDYNLRSCHDSIYDKCLLLHSEKKSVNVQLYKNSHFIPVYYWAHAYIALDWFRYAKYVTILPAPAQARFLIYNRAWAGAREYRLKFVELLQQHCLGEHCYISFNPVDPESGIHYSNHEFKNSAFKPVVINEVFPTTTATSNASADFSDDDYADTHIEVVLETLFDDDRIQLTEKILRPIACGHPFILVSTPGCLQYLRDYGFKTFSDIIDESYDTEPNCITRLELIIATMKKIANWSTDELAANLVKLKEISEYNKQHFFSDTFFKLIDSELRCNLTMAFREFEDTNTSKDFIEHRKLYNKLPESWLSETRGRRKKNSTRLLYVLTKARRYYNRYLKSLIE
jgi:hypothetical protein